jgi:hypothetical protein
VEVSSPVTARSHRGGSKPAAAPAAHLPKRRTENSNPSAFRRPAAFQAVPAPWLVHPPRAEGGEIESHGVTRASASNGARRPGRFTFHNCTLKAAYLLSRVMCPIPFSVGVRRAGVEPARPKASVPGTDAAASYATSACTPVRARVTGRIRTGPPSLASSSANR